MDKKRFVKKCAVAGVPCRKGYYLIGGEYCAPIPAPENWALGRAGVHAACIKNNAACYHFDGETLTLIDVEGEDFRHNMHKRTTSGEVWKPRKEEDFVRPYHCLTGDEVRTHVGEPRSYYDKNREPKPCPRRYHRRG